MIHESWLECGVLVWVLNVMVEHFGGCWGPSASEGPQKQDLTVFLEYNV
jgi:hypothetical protein